MLPTFEELEEDYILVRERILDKTRWSVICENIYSDEDETVFYKAVFGHGATEYQDNDGEATITEVVPVQKTIIAYIDKI